MSDHQPPSPDEIHFCDAAVRGYRAARERPEMSDADVRAELAALAAVGDISRVPPPFASERISHPYYLTLADAFAFPLAPGDDLGTVWGAGWVATTCWIAARDARPSQRAKKRERRRSTQRTRRSSR